MRGTFVVEMLGKREKGSLAEDAACRWLLRRGFEIVDRNVRCRFGELDVVARRRGVIFLVEVRSRREGSMGPMAVESISRRKLRRIWLAGHYYLKSKRGQQKGSSEQLNILIVVVNWYNSGGLEIEAIPVC